MTVPVFTPPDKEQEERFREACRRAACRPRGGIGTLNEKSLHAALKFYYEENAVNHEVRVGEHVADIIGEDGVIEIQTRALYRLGKKLSELLGEVRVTVVYPLEGRRYVDWIEPETGELAESRRSPKRTGIYHALGELYGIRDQLKRPGLTIRLPLLETRHQRLLNGRSKDRKRGSAKADIIPSALLGEAVIEGREDYRKFLPELVGSFTVQDFARAAGTDRRTAWRAVTVLTLMGALREDGQSGRSKLYRISD